MSAKMSFTLDAGKILAKLHRGAVTACKNKVLFFNSGIQNDGNINAEAVESSKINFALEGGEFELGVSFPVEFNLNAPILPNEIQPDSNNGKKEDEKDANNKKSGEDANAEKTGEAQDDKKPGDDANAKKPGEDANTKQSDGKESKDTQKSTDDKNVPITQNPDQPAATNEAVEKPEDVRKMFPDKYRDQIFLAMTNISAEIDHNNDYFENASEAARAAVEKNHDSIKKIMESYINNARDILKGYMTVFAGSTESNKIKNTDIAVTFLPDKFKDPYKIKSYNKYQIPSLTDAETRTYKITQLQKLKAGATSLKFDNMCFKIAYSANIGK